MAGLPPGDPQLVSMIVNHLKTQGLFDQFRRDCLADVDTKPAYLNLKQRVDNFVSNHLSNHTWSPHLNKNQLRNNIRQLVLQSGMLEQGVDRIVTQVVDPKINHIFRPQVERVVREFLSPGSCSQEPPAPLPPAEIKTDSSIPEQASLSTPTITAASDAMSILDTITSLNQEASVRASSATEKGPKGQALDDFVQLVEENVQDMNIVEEGDDSQDGKSTEEAEEAKVTAEDLPPEVKTENTQEEMELDKEGSVEGIKIEEEESGAQESTEEEKDKRTTKMSGKSSEEKQDDDDGLKSTSQAKQRAERERIKEEYSLEDSDLEGLSDITVSSVHTSDLSSFEEESDEEEQPSDSSEEGELPPDEESERAEKKQSAETGDEDKESKPRRKAYVHKPFLYSRYYSDSDDEITVEERRRSAAKEKEERLLKRQQNRERMEEKRKQKAAQAEEQDLRQRSADSGALECPKAKEARKERKVLEKKMALNRKRKLDSRKGGEVSSKKKGNMGDITKKAEIKSSTSKTPQPKLVRNLSESASSDEKHRRMSGGISEDSSDTKKLSDRSRTHSFILDLEQGSQEALKQRSIGKFDRLSRKELHSKERKDKERSLSDERTKLKQKQEKKSEHPSDDSQMKEGTAVKVSAEEKSEKKPKAKGERKMSASTREGKVAEGVPEEGGSKDAKKVKVVSGESVKAEKEKDKSREKDKMKEKGKAEKSSVKSDLKQLLRPDSAGSSEDRSDMEPGSDSAKKREKHPKDVLKRSKSHSEDRSGDKPKSKTDSEKEKAKADQDSQKLQKPSSETDKDPKRVKTTEKGKIAEKPKVKSKEEVKIPLSLKTDKKVQSSDVRGAGGAGVAKPEAAKEKRKDGNAKEQRRGPGESSHDKPDLKSSKKKLEKKDKISEKKDESQDEKTTREEKLEKSDKSSKSPSVSLSLETEEPPKKQPPLQEASTDSDPVTTTIATSLSDDTCDALSDITPEPPEGETESRLDDVPAVPAENDALLTLMDVCTSAEARLSPERLREEASAKAELQDAEMKMKEAALTLLSMDPDSIVSSSLICEDRRDEALLYHLHTEQEDAAVAEEEALPPGQVQPVYESQLSVSETSPAACVQTAELADEKPDSAEESGQTETAETETTEVAAPPEDDPTSNTCQIYSKEEDTKSVETSPDTQLDEKMAAPSDQEGDSVPGADKTDWEEASGSTLAVSDTTEQVSEIPSKPEQTEPDVEVLKTNFGEVGAEAEEKQTRMVVHAGEAESTNADGNVPAEEGDVQTMETDIPETSEEAESESKLVKQTSNVSSTDSQEDEKSSDLSGKEEKKDGRGRRKRKLSCQKADDMDEKGGKEQLSVEETEKDNVVEVRATRRGRSSRTTEEAENEQPKEPEKCEEPPSRRGGRPGAAAKETAADNPKCDENRAEDIPVETSSLEAIEKEEKGEDECKPVQIVQSGDEDNLPAPALEDNQGAGSSDLREMADTCEPALKRKRSEEVEESSEETQAQGEMKDNEGQEQITEDPEKDSGCCPPSQSEDVEEEVCSENKPDDAAEEQQEDQEAAPKKPARRGRPPKAASTEDSDKKDKKADEKDNEQNDEEEEEEEKEGDEKETATRATTRLASRLEAEKNKPSKPSTRASRQNGKEETAAGTRGTRGQAATKGGRKREASPPAVRTRGGQKSEELPSKRAKR